MMLWHKTWLESRARFLTGAVTIGTMSIVAVLFHDSVRSYLATKDAPLDTYSWYLCRVVYQGFARGLFMVFALVLGLGGLLRERELGTVGFTLALPVSRARLLAVRAATGFVELAMLCLLPAILIPLLSPVNHLRYPLSQALEFALLWLSGGLAHFALAFAASAVLGGEYTAFVASWTISFGHTVTTQYLRLTHPSFKPYLFTVHEVSSGFRMWYFDTTTHLLTGPLPIVILAVVALIALGLIAAAVGCTERRDF